MGAPDVPRAVRVHVAAFPGFFLSFLGPRFLRLFYGEAVLLREVVLVADLDGAVVGLVMGSTHPGRFFKALLRRRLLGFALAAAPAVLRRPSVALRVARALFKPSQAAKVEGTATLMSIAVGPEAQGLGAGKALVLAFIDEAARRGAVKVDLTTDKVDNERTNAFYRALGFRVAREIVTPEQRTLNEYELDLPAH
jgi:ribosomal protein S18 acetylase RimI-like enzyme